MKIVNVKGMHPDSGIVYCGREWAGWPSSVWGNPYREGRDGSRTEIIEKFRVYLQKMLAGKSPAARNMQEELADLTERSVLGCWCTPLRCHCEVIAEEWEKRYSLDAEWEKRYGNGGAR